ncbi:hypothetical protein J437_LFUL019107 [Ladona fulva]|uniref:Cytochrome P450 n=1 Tax=Ladona fulva TaxID=123851 RepID=A0A8K0PAS2_LADFU|nr:hypothetical protein J437_LFUL019107 [Ladona fulva]
MAPLYIVSAIAIAVIVKFFTFPLWYWKVRNVPSVSAVPILGSMTSALLLTKALPDVYGDIYKKANGKRYMGFVKFIRPAILMKDPELIKNTLNRDFDHFNSNDVFIDEKVDPMFGKHIFALNGERWKKLRVALSPGFSSGKMKGIYPLVGEAHPPVPGQLTKWHRTLPSI